MFEGFTIQKLNWGRETIRLLFKPIIRENNEAGFPASEPGFIFASLEVLNNTHQAIRLRGNEAGLPASEPGFFLRTWSLTFAWRGNEAGFPAPEPGFYLASLEFGGAQYQQFAEAGFPASEPGFFLASLVSGSDTSKNE